MGLGREVAGPLVATRTGGFTLIEGARRGAAGPCNRFSEAWKRGRRGRVWEGVSARFVVSHLSYSLCYGLFSLFFSLLTPFFSFISPSFNTNPSVSFCVVF